MPHPYAQPHVWPVLRRAFLRERYVFGAGVRESALGPTAEPLLPSGRPFRFHVYPWHPGELDALELAPCRTQCDVPYHGPPEARGTTAARILDRQCRESHYASHHILARYLRLHPLHTDDPGEAAAWVVPGLPVADWLCRTAAWDGLVGHGAGNGTQPSGPRRLVSYSGRIRTYSDFLNAARATPQWRRYGGRGHFLLNFFYPAPPPYHGASLLTFENYHPPPGSITIPYTEFSSIRAGADRGISKAHGPRPILAMWAGSTEGYYRHQRTRVILELRNAPDCAVAVRGSSGPLSALALMGNATFCPLVWGTSRSSRRTVSAVLAGCIPVLMHPRDFQRLPFEEVLDWDRIILLPPAPVITRYKSADQAPSGAVAIGGSYWGQALVPWLRSISREEIVERQRAMDVARRHLVYHTGPPIPGDAVDVVVMAMYKSVVDMGVGV